MGGWHQIEIEETRKFIEQNSIKSTSFEVHCVDHHYSIVSIMFDIVAGFIRVSCSSNGEGIRLEFSRSFVTDAVDMGEYGELMYLPKFDSINVEWLNDHQVVVAGDLEKGEINFVHGNNRLCIQNVGDELVVISG